MAQIAIFGVGIMLLTMAGQMTSMIKRHIGLQPRSRDALNLLIFLDFVALLVFLASLVHGMWVFSWWQPIVATFVGFVIGATLAKTLAFRHVISPPATFVLHVAAASLLIAAQFT